MIERADLDEKYVGTCFDRQVRIQLWDQDKLSNQIALILGIGGLGSVVMMNLLRLGIKKLILVDYDTVDIHNLNRQLMFSPADVGETKVDAAQKNARFHNIANTQITTFHGNALTNWNKIIEFAKQSNIVFNCIDYGDKFDLAVASLCMKVQIPLIMGGTFSTMYTVDFLHPDGVACYLCLNEETGSDVDLVEKIKPDHISELSDISFLPKNDNPISRSSPVVCTLCGELMMSHFLNFLFLSESSPYKTARLIGYHNTFEIINFQIEIVKTCLYCGDPNYVQPPKQEQTNQAGESGGKVEEKNQQNNDENETQEKQKVTKIEENEENKIEETNDQQKSEQKTCKEEQELPESNPIKEDQ